MFHAVQANPSASSQAVTGCQALSDVFDQLGARVPYSRDSEIFGQDEPAEFLYRVVSGAVRTTRLLSDGRRQVGGFYYAGEVFGLESGDLHRFSAEALGECVVGVVKKSCLRLADRDGSLERLIWKATARELERTQEHMLLLGRKSACERVASFLGDMANRAQRSVIDLAMGRQDMADYLGLTIETVSRMLSQLQADRVIQMSGPRHLEIRSRGALQRLGFGEPSYSAAA